MTAKMQSIFSNLLPLKATTELSYHNISLAEVIGTTSALFAKMKLFISFLFSLSEKQKSSRQVFDHADQGNTLGDGGTIRWKKHLR